MSLLVCAATSSRDGSWRESARESVLRKQVRASSEGGLT
jgi:hypothetical protein